MLAEFQREYLLRLPLPLAQLYSRAHNSKHPRERHDNTFYLFEATIKLAAAPLIAAYVREISEGAPRVSRLDSLLANLALPSFGHWVAILRELAAHFGNRPDAAAHSLGHLQAQLTTKHRELAATIALFRRTKNGPDADPAGDQSCSLLQVFESLVVYRNLVFGHGAGRFASFYEHEMGPLLLPAATEILAEGVFDLLGPRGTRLVYIADIRTISEEHIELGMYELVGREAERMPPLQLLREDGARLVPHCVALLWPGHRTPLRLDPLLVYRGSDLCDELLLLNRDRNQRQVEYLSYTTGRTERDPSTAPALTKLLSLIAGRALNESDIERMVDEAAKGSASLETAPPDLTRATCIGDFEIVQEVGRGGMGVVYLAKQLSLGRLVALKMLPADLAGDEVALARFRREIRALGRCDHPNIVKLLSSGVFPDGRWYYVMEYVPGADLELVWREIVAGGEVGAISALDTTTWDSALERAFLRQREANARRQAQQNLADETRSANLTVQDDAARAARAAAEDAPFGAAARATARSGYMRCVASLVRDAALAVQAVHDQGIVHRDIKPANLMIAPNGRVVLMDFGLAKGHSLTATATKAAGFQGTLRYAAPEQLAAARLKIGPQVDVRALGCALWELLARKRLYGEADDESQLASMVLTRDVPPLRSIDPSLDRDLEAIVTRATERDSTQRIQTARQLAEYLQLYLDGKTLPIRMPSMRELMFRWLRQNPAIAALSTAVIILLVLGTTVSTLLAIEARDRADEAIKNAKRAEVQRVRADQAATTAKEREKEAEAAREKEAEAREDATEAYQSAEYNLRIKEVELAERIWLANDAARARRLLDEYPAERRNWEWHYVKRLCDGNPVIATHADAVHSAAYDAEGLRAVTTSGPIYDETNGAVSVWDLETGQRLAVFDQHDNSPRKAAFRSDGLRIVSVSSSDAVVWRIDDGSLERHIKFQHATEYTISPDGSRLAYALSSGNPMSEIVVVDTETGVEVRRFETEQEVSVLKFNNDATLLASVRNTTIQIWNMETDSPQQILTVPHDEESMFLSFVFDAAFSPDNAELATAHFDNIIRLWNLETGEEKKILDGHESAVRSVAYSSQGDLASGSWDHTLCIWQPESGRIQYKLRGHGNWITDVAFSPSGASAISSSWDGTMRTWSAIGPEQQARRMNASQVWLDAVAIHPGGRRLAGLGSKSIVVWQVRTGIPQGSYDGDRFVDFNYDGSLLATAGSDVASDVSIWQIERGGDAETLQAHTGTVMSGAFHPTKDLLLSTDSSGTAILWDVRGKSEILRVAMGGSVVSCTWGPDGTWFATGASNGDVSRWNAADGSLMTSYTGMQFGAYSLATNGDGKYIAAAGGEFQRAGEARIWEVETSKPVSVLHGHTNDVTSVRFTPDGSRVFTASYDGNIIVWDTLTGSSVLTLRGHSREVTCLALSKSGSILASGGRDGAIRVWDATPLPAAAAPAALDTTANSPQASPAIRSFSGNNH